MLLYHGNRSFVKIFDERNYKTMTNRLTEIITEIRQNPEITEALKALCYFIRSAELPAEVSSTAWMAAAHRKGGAQA